MSEDADPAADETATPDDLATDEDTESGSGEDAEPEPTVDDQAGDSEYSGDDQPVDGSELISFHDDGSFTVIVHDAGEIDVQLDGASLSLIEARAHEGWSYDVDEEGTGEIEVEFDNQDREIDVEIEIDSQNRLEIELDANWDDAAGGVYSLGDAGEIEIDYDGNEITLVEIRASEGWDHHIGDQASDELEIDFVRNFDQVDFDAEIDDGLLEIDIDIDLYFEID